MARTQFNINLKDSGEQNRLSEKSIGMKDQRFIVDLQGFQRSPNIFVLKEAAIINMSETALHVIYHFKPPVDWNNLSKEEKCTARWLERHHHGMAWNSGEIRYKKIAKVLFISLRDTDEIYVKGLQKKLWLQDLLPNALIYNVEDSGCPNLKDLKLNADIHCSHHVLCKGEPVCAVKNASKLRSWISKSYDNWDQDEVDHIDDTSFDSTVSMRHAIQNEDVSFSMYN